MTKLQAAVEAMLDAQRQMGLIAAAARKDPARRAELVAQRRAFAFHVSAVTSQIDLNAELAAKPELQEQFRQRFSKMRHLIAIHQGKWPAVLLGDADHTYQPSVDGLVKENTDFSQWMKTVLR